MHSSRFGPPGARDLVEYVFVVLISQNSNFPSNASTKTINKRVKQTRSTSFLPTTKPTLLCSVNFPRDNRSSSTPLCALESTVGPLSAAYRVSSTLPPSSGRVPAKPLVESHPKALTRWTQARRSLNYFGMASRMARLRAESHPQALPQLCPGYTPSRVESHPQALQRRRDTPEWRRLPPYPPTVPFADPARFSRMKTR